MGGFGGWGGFVGEMRWRAEVRLRLGTFFGARPDPSHKILQTGVIECEIG